MDSSPVSVSADAGLLVSQASFHLACWACDLLTRGLARVGIIARVDEATGYQDVRGRRKQIPPFGRNDKLL